MKRGITVCAFIMIVMALAPGCASMGDVVEDRHKGEGLTKTYAVSFDQAWDISRTVFRSIGADAIEEHRDERYMLTSTSMNLLTAGTVMGAWIEPISNNNVHVTVITKRRVATNIFTKLTKRTFHERFAKEVATIASR